MGLVATDEPKVGFVHQGRRLERLPRPLPGETLMGELSQLAVDQRQEFLRRPGVTLLDGREEASDFIHRQRIPAMAERHHSRVLDLDVGSSGPPKGSIPSRHRSRPNVPTVGRSSKRAASGLPVADASPSLDASRLPS
jgi:hypothetical protein